MPKFTQAEREAVSKALLEQGERLFCEYGLRKVAVEEITRAVGIAKGSFYTFYESKEALYFDILTRCQQDMWRRMEGFLTENAALAPRALAKAAVAYVFGILAEYPLIQRTDGETMMVLMRKLPQAVIGQHLEEDVEAVELLARSGVRFTQPAPVAAKAFQALYGAAMMLAQPGDELAARALDLMTSGLVNELVEET